MNTLQAVLIVLYDNKADAQSFGGMHSTSIAEEILQRELFKTTGVTFAKSVLTIIRKHDYGFIELAAPFKARSGYYRLVDREKTAVYLRKVGLWHHTNDAKKERAGETVSEVVSTGATPLGQGQEILGNEPAQDIALKPLQKTPEKEASAGPRSARKSRAEQRGPLPTLIPEEIAHPENCIEGAVKRISVNAYERNRKARIICLQHHGYACIVCGFDFFKAYGEIGREFAHVHHLRRIAKRGGTYKLNPKKDLCPICANCHAMIHRRDEPFTVSELNRILREQRERPIT
jgi:5-methylcytosine-specific restriction endonuclease McrA